MFPKKNNLAMTVWAGVAVWVALGSTWIVPLRMLFGEGHSYFTFAIVGDEIIYAEKLQPLIDGTSAVNTINGIGDTRIISPLFLECLLRESVTWLHLDIITFFWIWRFVFPVAMLGMLFWLGHVLLGRRRRKDTGRGGRSRAEMLALAALLYGCLNLSYEICVDFPVLQGWLMRIPTCVEYPLALAILIGLWRLMVRRTVGSAIFLAGALAAAAYLRPFTIIPWTPACALAVSGSWWSRSLALRPIMVGVAAGIILVTPLLGIVQYNQDFPAYQQLMARIFSYFPYAIHYRSFLFIGLGLAVAGSGWLLKGRSRRLIVSMGITLMALPFFAGIPATLRSELLCYDRFGYFYLIAMIATLLMLLRRYVYFSNCVLWLPTRRTLVFSLAAMGVSGWVGARNGTYDFNQLNGSPYQRVNSEIRYLKGYQYVAEHTPSKAWVLLDDGIDWGQYKNADVKPASPSKIRPWTEDLFGIVARRKRYDNMRLYGSFLTDYDYRNVCVFQWMTLGYTVFDRETSDEYYGRLFKRFNPDYIFWKRDAPVPRGQGARLKPASEIVYADEFCEIWKLRYPDVLKIFSVKGRAEVLH